MARSIRSNQPASAGRHDREQRLTGAHVGPVDGDHGLEVAAELFLSPHTVRTQSKSIYRKLGAPTRSYAVVRARQLGLLDG